MKVLELIAYNPEKDEPKTGWDEFSVEQAIQSGKKLYVDQFGDIWTDGKREYIGKIRKRDYSIIKSLQHPNMR